MAGTLWMPEGTPARTGFLLCRPFGSEAIRASMFYRALAMRLAAEGSATLSFDYHGTGESPGEGKDQTMLDWQRDVLVADSYLRRHTGVARCHWFGLGLGAALAARAALETLATNQRPAHIVLWEPVENGNDYARTLCTKHRSEMERWFRARWSVIRRDLDEPEPSLPGTVLGFEIGADFAHELALLDGLPTAALLAAGVRVTAGRPAAATPWTPSPRLRTISVEHPVDWMTNHAADGEEYRDIAIVPNDAIVAARETLRAPGPVLL